jgi:2-C-methyl-D-erythritol 4-phosphate cytidylyltransferase
MPSLREQIGRHDPVNVWAILLAAGNGDRFGAPKQYQPLGGQRVVDWSLVAARQTCAGLVLVVPVSRTDDLEGAADAVVAGGATRSSSVRAGLAAVPEDADVIVVHDASRPLASVDLWRAVIDAVTSGHDGAVPAVPVTDTLREVGGGTVDRSRFLAVQTPQAFRGEVLRRAHKGDGEATDDAGLVETIGGSIAVVDGEHDNVKITTPADLRLVAGLVPGA